MQKCCVVTMHSIHNIFSVYIFFPLLKLWFYFYTVWKMNEILTAFHDFCKLNWEKRKTKRTFFFFFARKFFGTHPNFVMLWSWWNVSSMQLWINLNFENWDFATKMVVLGDLLVTSRMSNSSFSLFFLWAVGRGHDKG